MNYQLSGFKCGISAFSNTLLTNIQPKLENEIRREHRSNLFFFSRGTARDSICPFEHARCVIFYQLNRQRKRCYLDFLQVAFKTPKYFRIL